MVGHISVSWSRTVNVVNSLLFDDEAQGFVAPFSFVKKYREKNVSVPTTRTILTTICRTLTRSLCSQATCNGFLGRA